MYSLKFFRALPYEMVVRKKERSKMNVNKYIVDVKTHHSHQNLFMPNKTMCLNIVNSDHFKIADFRKEQIPISKKRGAYLLAKPITAHIKCRQKKMISIIQMRNFVQVIHHKRKLALRPPRVDVMATHRCRGQTAIRIDRCRWI